MLTLVLALCGAPPARAQNQPDFFGLGDLSGGAVSSAATAVSADGLVVVGESESGSGTQAFRWTEAGGMVGLGDLSGGDFLSTATGVSANGAVVAGTSSTGDGSAGFRWSGGSMVRLDQLSCSPFCAAPALASGISPDGLVVVGSGTHKTTFGDPHGDPLRWPGGGTNESILATPPGGGASGTGGHTEVGQANDANQTGTILVGEAESNDDIRAVVWTSSGSSATVLPSPPGAQPSSTALAISSDGSTVVGAVNTSSVMSTSLEAARWTGSGWSTLTLLGNLGASSPRSRAYDTTSDGAIIVGTARDASGQDRAFLWDAAHGMRDLAQVLLADYGIDTAGWVLAEARGVSNPNAAGEFVVVGTGTNPSGQDEGWYAFLSPVACNDGLDNDSDGDVDFPDDPECNRASDRSETNDCNDGLDNDGDGDVDAGADPGCNSATDPSEEPDCADGLDNDGDGLPDFPADPGCRRATQHTEDPACNDGLDNDGDGQIDFPADKQCLAADDFSEVNDCNDGLDNDGDGLVDHPADPDCELGIDPAEDPQCDDRVNNDGDLTVDYPAAYPACLSASDPTEAPQCDDGVDVDGDGQADHPEDPECPTQRFVSESPVYLGVGQLLVLDRASRTLFRLDPGTGAQTRLSQGAQLSAPQGMAMRASGELVVADASGLYEVTHATGAQRRFGDLVEAEESTQVVIDANGDAVVLEADGLAKITWSPTGTGTRTVLLTVPFDPFLGLFRGDSLARESDGKLLVSAFGFGGEGIFRVDASTVPPTYQQVSPFNATDRFTDLAVEPSGNIVAVGQRIAAGLTGVFRVTPSGAGMGTAATLSSGAAWVSPVAVAVAPNGELFVGDEGSCGPGGCTGSNVVRVHPTTGARLQVYSGGDITGPVDLAFVSALAECQDGDDDDGDGQIDFPADPNCNSPSDVSELPDCADGLDNDGDGTVDHPADPGCAFAVANVENPQCSDGFDNDGDGLIDHPADPGCGSASAASEAPKSGCGLTGFELLPLFALYLRQRRRRR